MLMFELQTADVMDKYPNIRFKIIQRRGYVACQTNNAGNMAAEEYHGSDGATAFIGPGCSAAVDIVGRLASYWNIPVCTAAGVSAQFEDRSVYSTLLRLALTINTLGDAITHVLKLFDWHHVVILSDSSQTFFRQLHKALSPIMRNFQREGYELTRFNREFESKKQPNYTNLLLEGRAHGRIFLLGVDGIVLRQIMLCAYDLGMGNGEYAFIAAKPYTNVRYFGEYTWNVAGDKRNEDARKMYEQLMVISLIMRPSREYKKFVEKVVLKSKAEQVNGPMIDKSIINELLGGFYDCVQLYAWAVNKTLSEGKNPLDGKHLINEILKSTQNGLTGMLQFNENGDRMAEYAIHDFNSTGQMDIVAMYSSLNKTVTMLPNKSFLWLTGSSPRDVPICGFLGEAPHCREIESPILLIVITVVTLASFLGMAVIALIFYRKMKLETQLANLWWHIKWDEISYPDKQQRKSATSLSINGDGQNNGATESKTSPRFGTGFPVENGVPGRFGNVHIGIYKGMKVAVRQLRICKFTTTRSFLLELKQMHDLTHENLVRLIGLTAEDLNVGVVMEYCPRGSLRDLLENESLRLDWTFRYSIINDIVEGMCFLHSNFIGCHGRLRSTTCLIDARFVVKISNFGLRELRRQVALPEIEDPRDLLWCAPEHLRGDLPLRRGSQKGDVYSFAIILQEIITRSGPFENLEKYSRHFLPPEEILFRVKLGSNPPFRPDVTPDDCPRELLSLMKLCWNESPSLRPSFAIIKQLMKKYTKSMGSSNLLDNLLKRMEQYANNLEQLVENKTALLVEEKRKSDELLYEVLPRYVAEQLKRGEYVKPEAFEWVTICFSDIVGFTQICANSTPMQVVDLLNDLYSCFDAIIQNYDVFKVETIGDAYMVVSGLPVRNGNEHAREIARMTLSLLKAIKQFRVRHHPTEKLQLRIGVHSGPCAAAVVGLKRPRYCLFGDSVNTASRMESYGEAMMIHITGDTKRLLDTFGTFKTTCRGEIQVKGKGQMITYFLEAEDPPFSPEIGLQGTFFTNEHLLKDI
ncbi:atrial natriuretic peptide receptor 1-like isoform X3 [Varroa destructor]|uniref:guanylate cyclase n=1 Tax=Varroa destructor TaxID=109461 RepID=A0A7M7KR56_VARDE|nr:atrial natriuretic peptide receptor 1-like isoform X3 [Varroa destructor]